MEHLELVQELCYIYSERNKLQDRRNSTRFKLCRAKTKFIKCKSAANRMAVMKATKASLDVRIAIAEHVAKTNKRIRELTKITQLHPYTMGCNKIKYLRTHPVAGVHREWIACSDFQKYGEAYLVRLAVEDMLKGQ